MNAASLNALIDLATEKRDAAATELGARRGEYGRRQAQLEALLAYRDEYRERLDRAMAEGLSMTRLENDQRFLAALDEAIAQQRQAVCDSESWVAEGRVQWQDRERRLKSFDALASRQARARARREARREQQQTDEAASRTGRNSLG